MDLVVLPLRLTHRLTSGLPPLPLGRVKLGLSPRPPKGEGPDPPHPSETRPWKRIPIRGGRTTAERRRYAFVSPLPFSVHLFPSPFAPPENPEIPPVSPFFRSFCFFRVLPSPRVEATDDDVHHIDAFAHEKARFNVRGGGWKGPRKAGRSTDAPEREPGTP